MEPSEQDREISTSLEEQALAQTLVDRLGLVGSGRVEIILDDDGRVVTLWEHRKTRYPA